MMFYNWFMQKIEYAFERGYQCSYGEKRALLSEARDEFYNLFPPLEIPDVNVFTQFLCDKLISKYQTITTLLNQSENVYLSGGLIPGLVHQYACNDIDIFVDAKESDFTDKFLKHPANVGYGNLNFESNYAYVNGFKVNFIKGDFKSPVDVIKNFDIIALKHCVYLENGRLKVLTSEESYRDLMLKIIRWNKNNAPSSERIAKYRKRGFSTIPTI